VTVPAATWLVLTRKPGVGRSRFFKAQPSEEPELTTPVLFCCALVVALVFGNLVMCPTCGIIPRVRTTTYSVLSLAAHSMGFDSLSCTNE